MARFTQGGGSGDGSALNYVQVVGTQQTISTAPNAIIDLDITTTGKPVQISVTGEGANASAGSWLRLNLFRDNVEIGNAIQLESSGASENVPFAINFIDDIQAGTYNYSARVTTINGGNWTFGEAAGPVMNAVELTGFKGDRGPRGFTGEQGPQGEPGEGSGADIADFTFTFTPQDDEEEITAKSRMTINNHDMVIETTRDGQQDSDISISSADDVWITANDSIELTSLNDQVTIYAGSGANAWTFQSDAGLRFPDQTVQTTAYTGGSAADIADFVFTNDQEGNQSTISLPGSKQMRIEAGDNSDLYLTSGDDIYIQTVGSADDIHLNAADDIRFTTNNEDFETQRVYEWTMNDSGVFNLPGNGSISNPSGDGTGNDMIRIIPDNTLGDDQHIVIEPIEPNQIHIRAGGTINESSAALVFGGERNHVYIEDGSREVIIHTRPEADEVTYRNMNQESNETFVTNMPIVIEEGSTVTVGGANYSVTGVFLDSPVTGVATVTATGATFVSGTDYTFTYEPTYNNEWTFRSDGYINGPAEGGLLVSSIVNNNGDLLLQSGDNVVLDSGDGGEFLGSPNIPGNQIATLGDIAESHGNFEFVSDTLEVRDSAMRLKAYGGDEVTLRGEIELHPGNDRGMFRIYDDQTDQLFGTSSWATAAWTSTGDTSSQLALTGATEVVNYLNDNLRDYNRRISINSNTPGIIDGWGTNGTDITIYILDMPVGEETTVENIDIYSAHASTIKMDYDDNEMNFDAQNMDINLTTTGTRDINLISADEINLYANDTLTQRSTNSIRFTSNYDTINRNWSMDTEGRFNLPADGYISNPQGSVEDGTSDTIHIVPDSNLDSDQYIIIDPTGPDHIHIRPGGDIDSSSADLILGGEMNNVTVSDHTRDVSINTRKATVTNTYLNTNSASSVDFITSDSADITYGAIVNVNGTDFVVNYMMFNSPEPGLLTVRADGAIFEPSTQYTFVFEPTSTNEWRFETNGKIYGPGEDGALILGGELLADSNMSIRSTGESVVLNGALGEFLGSSDNVNNQIATIGDVNAARFGASASFFSTADQGPFAANAIQAFTFNDVDWANDIILIDMTKLTMINAGKYNIAFSAQMHQTNGSGIVNIWLNKNGTPVANSNTKVAITANNPYSVAAWNLFVDAAAEDYYELMWSSDSNNTVIEYEAATGSGATLHPAVPSIILTVNQVG